MREYFMSLIVAALIGTVLSSLAGGAFEKYIKYIVSLVCVVIILLPIKGLLGLTLNFDAGELETSAPEYEGGEKYIISTSKGRIAEAVKDALEKKFGLAPVSVDTEFNVSDGAIEVAYITVALAAGDALNAAAVKDYLGDLYGVEIRVVTREN